MGNDGEAAHEVRWASHRKARLTPTAPRKPASFEALPTVSPSTPLLPVSLEVWAVADRVAERVEEDEDESESESEPLRRSALR